MTRRDTLQCVHEPFGDAFYYGPERMGSRFEGDEKAIEESGFKDSTFQTIMDRLEREGEDVSRFVPGLVFFRRNFHVGSRLAGRASLCRADGHVL